jgi:DNA polymerase-3 subunit epsilon
MGLSSWFRRLIGPQAIAGEPSKQFEFAIVDVETTGLFPERHDRIVEIAVIRVDSAGRRLDEYCSLVNPNRDLGPTHIHGISAREAAAAPRFDEIAGDVVARLAGAVIVGHNVLFDFRFLDSEYNRLRCPLPEPVLLCTMHLSRRADPLIPGRKLGVCCSHFGINLSDAHSAYHDAEATARLLLACLNRLSPPGSSFHIEPPPPAKEEWPSLPRSRKAVTRSQSQSLRDKESSFIERMVTRLPSVGGSDLKLEEYFALLDRVLEDRHVTTEETDLLFDLATKMGLSREQVALAHKLYVNDLVRVAYADCVITGNEQRDLAQVRELLGVPNAALAETLAQVTRSEPQLGPPSSSALTFSADLVGRTVCFTGELLCKLDGESVSREMAERIAMDKGLLVRKNVTKSLDFLVIADAESMSSKARKAREYGIRILAEPVFWRMLGVNFE